MTRSDLRNLILSMTGRTDKTTVANAAIDLCLTRVGQAHDWWQTYQDYQLPISAGDASLVLPGGTERLTEIRLIFGLQSYPMVLLEKPELVKRIPNPAAVPPARPYYCYREIDSAGNDQLLFVPASNGNYAIEFTTIAAPSMGADDSSSCSVGNLDEVIVAYGNEYVYSSIAEWNEAGQWRTRYEQALAEAIKADQRRPATRHVMHEHGSDVVNRFGPNQVPSGDPQNDPFVQRLT